MNATLLLAAFLTLGPAVLSPEDVVDRAYAAFNAQDAGAFVALVSDDVRWMSVRGDQLKVELTGREHLRQYLVRYFSSLPSARSSIDARMTAGAHVTVHERVTWRRGERDMTQSALAVYEVRDGRITAVWYFETMK
jgi:uncharacterized protein (TIGR02246 family)